MPSPSRSIQQLIELQNQGSQSFAPNLHAVEESTPAGRVPLPPVSWWNFSERLRRAMRLSKAESAQFENQLGNLSEVRKHQDDVRTQTTRHAIELERVVVDDRRQRRAQEVIAGTRVRHSIYISDAAEVLGLYGERKVARVQSTFQDPAIREKTNSVIRMLVEHQMTELQIAAVGMRFNPVACGEEEGH